MTKAGPPGPAFRVLDCCTVAPGSDQIAFHSPLSPGECLTRLQNATSSRGIGSWMASLGSSSPLSGRVTSRKVVLEPPVALGRSTGRLVGHLEAADGGGTLLRGALRSGGGWPSARAGTTDIDALVTALERVARFREVPIPPDGPPPGRPGVSGSGSPG